jgi:glycosyltransferase involved in cell wall biosynthesis
MKKKYSALHVINALDSNYGGPSRLVPNQCASICLAGFEVGLAFVKGTDNSSFEFKKMKEEGVSFYPYNKFMSAYKLWKDIKKYDIVHVHGIWNIMTHLACHYAKIQKKPLVISPHGSLTPYALSQKKLKKQIAFKLYQWNDLENASALHATGDAEARYLRDLGLKTNVAVIANGIRFHTLPKHIKGIKNESRRMLFLSRIHPLKGTLELVRAVAALRSELKKGAWKVTIAGPGEKIHIKQMMFEANKLQISELFEFIGPVDVPLKWDLYDSSDIFILPSHSESFGLVVAEALSRRIPVITTKGAPWADLLSHRCGWWPAVDQKEIENAMSEAIQTSHSTLREMGERGRQLVHQKYNYEAMGRDLSLLYLWLLGKESRPTFMDKDKP